MKSVVDGVESIQNLNISRHILTADGDFPNNALLPLLYYQGAIQIDEEASEAGVRELLETNSWTNAWVDGIYDYHHYHSTAHEALVMLSGTARVQFGGPHGITLAVEKGDVVIIPAGVAHKKIEEADRFTCIGAYPEGQHHDLLYGKSGERPRADENIRKVSLPESDPLYGTDGPLLKNWLLKREA